MFIVLQKD